MQHLMCLAIGCAVLGPPMSITMGPQPADEPAIEMPAPIPPGPQPSTQQLLTGSAYRPIIGDRTRITFRSEAPMASFEGHSGKVLGFAIVEPNCLRSDWTPKEDDTGTPRGVLLAGAFEVPVMSINTGIAQRDTHMTSDEWLDAIAHPAVLFELAAYENPRVIRREAGVSTFEGTLIGDMVVHGTRTPLRIENATVAMMPEGETSVRFGPGDLLMIRCNYTLRLANFGLDHPLIGRSVGKNVHIEQTILMSSAPVDATPMPEPVAIETPPIDGELVDPKDIEQDN